jgi:hypothetical protein
LTQTRTTAKVRIACSHPMIVTLKFLRSQHGVGEVSEGCDRQQQADDEIGVHIFSQPAA